MVPVTALWLPILVSAAIVFVASSVIHMVLGYHKANTSPLLKLFLSRTDDLIARVSKRSALS